MSQSIEIEDFRGLQTSVAKPAPNSAKSCSNVVRHRTRGILEAQEGYTKKFADGLPANDTVLRKISAISWKDFHTFTVPDHGGKTITLAVGTYTKTGFFPANPTVDRFGVWARPYWDGAAWVDAWRELTEMFVFEVRSFSGTNRIFIDDVTRNYAFDSLAGYAGVFNNSYFLGWTMVFDQSFAEANDEKNFNLITACDFTDVAGSLRYYFDIFGAHADLTDGGTRAIGDKIAVYRSFVNKELPSSITSHIHSLLSEARLTSGNAATDVGLMVGFRDKSLGWATVDKEVDRVLADISVPDVWRYAFLHDTPQPAISSDPLEAKTWYIKDTLVLDDNSETELRNVIGGAASNDVTIISSANLSSDNPKAMVSDGSHLYVVTGSSPAVLFKIDINTLYIVGRLVLSENDCRSIAENGSYVYCGTAGTPGKIIKVDKLTMVEASVLVLSAGENIVSGLVVDDTSTFLYACTQTSNAILVQISIASFARIAAVTLTGSNNGYCIAYDRINLYAWVGCDAGSVVYVDLNTMTLGGTIATGIGAVKAVFLSGIALYAGDGSSPAKIAKIDILTLAEVGAEYTLSTAGNDICRALLHDGAHLFVGLETIPLKVAKLDVTIWPPAGDLYTLSGPTGFNNCSALVDNGTSILASSDIASGKIVKIKKRIESAILTGLEQLDFPLLVSAGTVPPRAKAIRLYMSEDDVSYYKIKDLGLYDTELTWEAAAYFHATTKHHYHKSQTISITGTDWANRGALASTNIGRTITDTGVIRYSHAAVAGAKTFAVGVRIGGVLEPNKVATSAQHGDGTRQWDVFPNNAINLLNVENDDGDQAKAVGAIGERVLVLKRRSAVLLTPQNSTLFEMGVVSRQDGIAGVQSLCAWNDELYWVGYFGWYKFSPRYGIEIISNPIRNDWLAVSTANKEAAKATIDIRNRMWIVTAGTKTWYYDLGRDAFVDGRSVYVDQGEIMEAAFTDAPTALKASVEGNVEFLFAGVSPEIYSLGEGELHDGGNFTFHYETNRIEIPLKGRQDGLLQKFFIKYASTIPITMKLYYDDDASETKSYTLPAAETEVTLLAPLSARCKAFRVRFEGTVSEQGDPTPVTDTFAIRLSESYFQIIPAGLNPNLTA